jgi:xylulose-5-phosphate/fructose-6-phosphate phosphoketolase
VKKRLLGHFGTTSGQNFIYVHLNRLIKERKLSAIYVAGPGHGGPAIVAQVYLEGTYTEYYPDVTRDEEGIGKLFKQFSFPGGIPSHVAPETPGSIHEGGELGYSLSHSFGAVLDKPDLTVFCVVGDGEAETGPLATSWHSNKFLNPITDGVVLPILHLNGFKIANPSVLSRIPMEELKALMTGYGYEPILVEGSSPAHMHPAFAAALNLCADKIKTIKENALLEQQQGKRLSRPTWPMIILKSPKGWTGPRTVDGVQIEGTFRSHQVPLSAPADNPDHLALLEKWLKSYEPEQQFDSNGRLVPELQALAPPPHLCMGNNRFTNPVIKPLVLPNFEAYAVNIDSNGRGETLASNTYTVGTFLRDVIEKNQHHRNFRMFGPDETKSNKLHAIYEVTDKQWMGESSEDDVNISTDGRMMEMLSEHQCEGWLEGYLLTGGHGLFNSYEAFIHIVSCSFTALLYLLRLPQLTEIVDSFLFRRNRSLPCSTNTPSGSKLPRRSLGVTHCQV